MELFTIHSRIKIELTFDEAIRRNRSGVTINEIVENHMYLTYDFNSRMR